MASILQGTTPTLEISFDPSDVSLSDVSEIELSLQNFNSLEIKHMADCVVDTEANSISYHFTQTETLALQPSRMLTWQIRLLMVDGEIVGTEQSEISVADLLSSEVMQ